MLKPYFICIIFLLTCLSFKGQNRGTIHVKKNEGMALKACICGKTDTVFISKKKLFNDSTTVDICNGTKVAPNKVLQFTADFLGRARQSFNKNKFALDSKYNDRFFKNMNNLPPLTTIVLHNIIIATKNGNSELHSSGNLIVVLTD